jgi:hypothetical protein
VAGANGNGQGIQLGALDKVGGLLRVGQQAARGVMVASVPWPSSLSPFMVSREPRSSPVRLQR